MKIGKCERERRVSTLVPIAIYKKVNIGEYEREYPL